MLYISHRDMIVSGTKKFGGGNRYPDNAKEIDAHAGGSIKLSDQECRSNQHQPARKPKHRRTLRIA